MKMKKNNNLNVKLSMDSFFEYNNFQRARISGKKFKSSLEIFAKQNVIIKGNFV